MKKFVPNTLTLSRLLLSPLLPSYELWGLEFHHAATLALALAMTDLCDGYLARQWKAQTKFGAQIDPVADGLLCASLFLLALHSSLLDRLFWLTFASYFLVYAFYASWLRVRYADQKPGAWSKAAIALLMASLLFVVMPPALIGYLPIPEALEWSYYVRATEVLEIIPIAGLIAATVCSLFSIRQYENARRAKNA